MSKNVNLRVEKLAKDRGLGARELSENAGIAYNTALTYQRDSGDRVSKDVLAKLAETLDVEVYEFFLGDEDISVIIDIARRLGIDVDPAKSYSDLLDEIRNKVTA